MSDDPMDFMRKAADAISRLSTAFDHLTDPANPGREREPSRRTVLYRLVIALDSASRDLELLATLYDEEAARTAIKKYIKAV